MPRFLIDTDTAGDDVTSLLLGLRWPDVEVVGITVAAGNVELDMCVRNALYTTEMAGRADVPVFPGADKPLMRDLVTAHYVHGEDGMGNSDFPPPQKQAEDLFAPRSIAELASKHAGELEIIAQAPLTNIALALREDPDLPQKLKRLWIMGGANNYLGNITPAAEFNFYVDPEAAKEVLAAGFAVTLVPWDVCVHDATLTREQLEPIISMGSALSEFYLAVNRAVWEFVKREHGVDGISHPDAIMMAMAIDHTVITGSQRCFVDVETDSVLTRGYSLVDKLNVLDRSVDHGVKVSELMQVPSGQPNAEVVTSADQARFTEMLIQVLQP